MLKKLKLTNFRNHKALALDLGQTTVMIGPNGAGKSNILESISLLSFARSYREDDKKKLVMFDKDFCSVKADDFEAVIVTNPRLKFVTKYKGITYKKTDFIGLFMSVVFSPESLSLITGGPAEKRRFLDIMISQTSNEYLGALIAFEKVRKQRNSLLSLICEGRAKIDELDFWDKEMSRAGAIIINYRRAAAKYLNENLTQAYSQISGESETLRVEFKTNTGDDYEEKLSRYRSIEVASGCSIIGPHRDNIVFYLNNLELPNYASRGEIRSATLAAKLSELRFLEDNKRKNSDGRSTEGPLLLLDDVFSEFDEFRRGHLFSLIDKYQTVITTTDKGHVPEEVLDRCSIINLAGKPS